MIDLHSHILPGLDDGARNLEEAMEMARLAVESGVTAMAATPHCTDRNARRVRAATLMLRDALQEAGIPLRLYMGMEIFGTPQTAALLREKKLFTINNSRYPLVEFSFPSGGKVQTQILQDMIRAGYRPLVAHPERYDSVRNDPELVNLWKKMGCLLQVNRGSLLGRFGSEPRQMALELVNRGFAAVVASDAHHHDMRTPWMQDVYKLLSREVSPLAADYLLLHNPRSILKNNPLPPAEPEWF